MDTYNLEYDPDTETIPTIEYNKKAKRNTCAVIYFYYAAVGSLLPFITLLFRAKGLTLDEISLLILIPKILYLFSVMLWAGIGDMFHLQKKLLPIAMLLTLPFLSATFFSENFQAILFFYCLYSFCFSPLLSQTDNAVMNIIGKNKNDYGKIRAWGSVAWGVSAWLVGIVTDIYSLDVILWIFIVVMGLGAVFAWQLPEMPKVKPEPYVKILRGISHDKRWIIFLFVAALAGYGRMVTVSYLSLFLQDLGASISFIGFATTTATIMEIPIFLLSPMILQRFGKMKIIRIALIGLALYCGFYSMLQTPFPALFIQLLNAFTHALFTAAGVSYIREISPKGFSASGQGLYKAIFVGIGGIMGALGGGFFYEKYGPNTLFLSVTIGAVIALLLLFFDSKNKKNSRFQTENL